MSLGRFFEMWGCTADEEMLIIAYLVFLRGSAAFPKRGPVKR
jgi:hypothetical protein